MAKIKPDDNYLSLNIQINVKLADVVVNAMRARENEATLSLFNCI
jgi:hypothetical protein